MKGKLAHLSAEDLFKILDLWNAEAEARPDPDKPIEALRPLIKGASWFRWPNGYIHVLPNGGAGILGTVGSMEVVKTARELKLHRMTLLTISNTLPRLPAAFVYEGTMKDAAVSVGRPVDVKVFGFVDRGEKGRARKGRRAGKGAPSGPETKTGA